MPGLDPGIHLESERPGESLAFFVPTLDIAGNCILLSVAACGTKEGRQP
jgi:hypothetical protein